MTAFRALLRHGLFGIMLAYALAVQAMLAGPVLAGPLKTGPHEICLTSEAMPEGTPGHGGHDCPCLVPGAGHGSASLIAPEAMALPMRHAVPFIYAAPFLPWSEGQGPESPAARGPPPQLV